MVVSLCVSPTDYFLRNWAACFEVGLNKLKVGFLSDPALCFARSIALGKSPPYPRYERDDASHLDLHVPLPRIIVRLDIEDGVISQKLFPS